MEISKLEEKLAYKRVSVFCKVMLNKLNGLNESDNKNSFKELLKNYIEIEEDEPETFIELKTRNNGSYRHLVHKTNNYISSLNLQDSI